MEEQAAVVEGIAACKLQISALSAAVVDMLSLMAVPSSTEVMSVVKLAKEAGVPLWVSFCVETDGMLLSGCSLRDTIAQVGNATDYYAALFWHQLCPSTTLRACPEEQVTGSSCKTKTTFKQMLVQRVTKN